MRLFVKKSLGWKTKFLFAWILMGSFSWDGYAKQSVAIIGGGGSGLVTAWLIENQYDVTLFEEQDRLGGHANTVDVSIDGETYPIDAGFEFFNEPLYPYFNRLLSLLKVPTREFPLKSSFFRTDQDFSLGLPPKLELRTFYPWQWWKFWYLHSLNRIMEPAKKIVDAQNTEITLEEFLEEQGLGQKALDDFFYPLFAGTWGTKVKDIKKFAAYPLLKWLVRSNSSKLSPSPGKEIIGGTRSYVKRIHEDLQNTSVLLSARIEKIVYSNDQYNIYADDMVYSFDKLIFAIGANRVSDLLAKSELESVEDVDSLFDLKSSLSNYRYFDTRIAVHGDSRLMPSHRSDWATFNIRSEGTYSQATVYKPWRSKAGNPIFRSWVTFDEHPETSLHPFYYLVEYKHLVLDLDFYRTQKVIAKLQGKNKIWMTGVYTYPDIDLHESVVCSAIHVAKELAPESFRLKQLLNSSDKNEATANGTHF